MEAIDAQDERVWRWRSVVTEPTYRSDFELGTTRGSSGLRVTKRFGGVLTVTGGMVGGRDACKGRPPTLGMGVWGATW